MQCFCIIYRLAVNFQKIVYNIPLGHAYLRSWEKKIFLLHPFEVSSIELWI